MATSLNNFYNKVGVIGAGSYGTAVAQIAAQNVEKVYVYARSQTRLDNFNVKRENNGFPIPENVVATNNIEDLTNNCTLLFGVVPSKNFRQMVRDFSPFLNPEHIMIHGTKGLDVTLPDSVSCLDDLEQIGRPNLSTMSEVITQESSIRRVGCLAGPNLSGEIRMGQPAGAIVASEFDEVIQAGKATLSCDRFKVFSSYDVLGAEFAGILKNVFAICSGILDGLGYGHNARALLITKGLHEMMYLGKHLGAESSAFLGIAGIGDLVATCSSPLSRNFTVGTKLAKGLELNAINEEMREVAEGIRTVQIFQAYCNKNKINAPFTETLYRVMCENKPVAEAVQELMNYRYSMDVDFL